MFAQFHSFWLDGVSLTQEQIDQERLRVQQWYIDYFKLTILNYYYSNNCVFNFVNITRDNYISVDSNLVDSLHNTQFLDILQNKKPIKNSLNFTDCPYDNGVFFQSNDYCNGYSRVNSTNPFSFNLPSIAIPTLLFSTHR